MSTIKVHQDATITGADSSVYMDKIGEYAQSKGISHYQLTRLDEESAHLSSGKDDIELGLRREGSKITIGVKPSAMPVMSVYNPLTGEDTLTHLPSEAESSDLLDIIGRYEYEHLLNKEEYTL